MGKEIERKWLVERLPDNMEAYSYTDIVQGYLCTEPVIRVRKDGKAYYLTYKGEGELEREEYNLPLKAGAFQNLLLKCDGIILEKRRYLVPVCDGKYTAELDVFKGAYKGLLYVEVEFKDVDEAKAFTALDWFGEEVTGKPGFSNSELAMRR